MEIKLSQIIGIVGFIGSGKNTVAELIEKEYHFVRHSFANNLKDAISIIFGWDRALLEGDTTESRIWRDKVDSWWAARLNIPHLTPRFILQNWGTDLCRLNFHNDIWIASLENKIRSTSDNIVISDCRFSNEIQSIKNQGGIIVRVSRGKLPVWYDWAVEYNNADDASKFNMRAVATSQESAIKYGIHESEYSWIGHSYNYTIQNNGSLEDLRAAIRKSIIWD